VSSLSLARPIVVIAVLVSALGWWYGSGLQPQWWLACLAPLPVLWIATRVTAPSAALAAFASYAFGGLNVWSYLHGSVAVPAPIVALAMAAPAIVFAASVLLYRRLMARGHCIGAAFAVPILWVVADFVIARLSPHGTFGNVAYTQANALPVIQIAAVTGIWGVEFGVLLLPATIAAITARGVSRALRLATALITLICVASALGYGLTRLRIPATKTVRVGLVSLERPERPSVDTAEGRALVARYVDAVDRLAAAGARLIVLPETSVASTSESIPAFVDAAQRHDVLLGVGVAVTSDQGARNAVLTFGPDASPSATYTKHHLIPGLEDQYTPGRDYVTIDGGTRTGLAICKDLDFQDIGRAYAGLNTQLLLVPAWDFDVDGWLHSRMAILRGVEGGVAIARAARRGRLTLSDDRGRIVAEASAEARDAELVGDLPIHDTRTRYAQWGDWFAWLNVAGLLVLIVLPPRGSKMPMA
jgi:apolipoprotein N-acyltransferase